MKKERRKNNELLRRIEKLEEAREHLQKAHDLIKAVFPNNQKVQTYFLDHLRMKVTQEHGYMSKNLNIDDLIGRLRREFNVDSD